MEKQSKQLATYDYTNQEDMLKKQLVRKGLIKQKHQSWVQFAKKQGNVHFATPANGFNDIFCKSCKRPLDRSKISKSMSHDGTLEKLQQELSDMKTQL